MLLGAHRYLQLYVVFRTCKPGVIKVCHDLNSPDLTGDLQIPASRSIWWEWLLRDKWSGWMLQ
jgi:hypothetical protein